MRVLFTTQPAYGHFHPHVPLARALAAAGHEVGFATSRTFCAVVEDAGFRAFPAGMDWDETDGGMGDTFPILREMRFEQGKPFVLGRIFAGITAVRIVPDLLRIAGAWRPDVLVRESTEFGAIVGAELLGVPHATVQVTAFASVDRHLEDIKPSFSLVRAAFGLSPDLELRSLYQHLLLSFVPPSFQSPEHPLPRTAHSLRDAREPIGSERTPPAVRDLPRRPTVYMTLGTVFTRQVQLFRATIDALRDEDVNLVVTVGPSQDPRQFDPLPPNTRVERFIPQNELLPHCELVIHHCGFGTMMACVAHGLPMIVAPLGADQYLNAARCEALGLGPVVPHAEFTPEGVLRAVRDVFSTGAYADAVRRLQAEWQALPGPERGVQLLERLVEGDRAEAKSGTT